ncbi:MAG: DUF4097 family beta strand repeat-containing protein [Bacillus sp. (in: firmicutes)]
MHKIILAFAAALMAIGLVGAVLTAKAYFSDKEETITKTYSPEDIHHIAIDTAASDIEIVRGNQDAEISIIYPDKQQPSTIELQDNTLKITSNKMANLIGFNIKNKQEKIILSLPEKLYGNISIKNSVGATLLKDLTTGNVKVQTSTGAVKLVQVTTDNIAIEAEVGAISVEHSRGQMVLENGTGTIQIKTDELTDPIEASTEIGAIQILTKKKPNDVFITAYTEIGSTQIYGEKTSAYKQGDSSTEITLKTTTGGITVKQQ